MRRLDRHRAAVEVVQFVSPTDGRCSYLLACGNTRAAALVDPDPEMCDDYVRELQASMLRLRAVFDSSDRGELPCELWEEVPRVGPTSRPHELQAGSHTLELAPHPVGAQRYTIWGSRGVPVEGIQYAPVHAAFGAFKVRVMPFFGDHPRRVGFLIEDRLFTGLLLRTRQGHHNETPETLFELSDHTIVYPGWAHGTQSISIIGAERRAVSRPVEVSEPMVDEATLEPELDRIIHEIPEADQITEEMPEPELLPETNLEPMDYWTALETGRQFLRERRYEEARASFVAALADRPGDSIARQNLARLDEITSGSMTWGAP